MGDSDDLDPDDLFTEKQIIQFAFFSTGISLGFKEEALSVDELCYRLVLYDDSSSLWVRTPA